MPILHDLLKKLKNKFTPSRQAEQRGTWLVCTLLAIIIPFTSSKTSSLLRCLNTFFGIAGIRRKPITGSWRRPRFPLAPAMAMLMENDPGTIDQ